MSDLESVTKRIEKVENKARILKDKESVFEMSILSVLKTAFEKGVPARNVELTNEQRLYAEANYHLLTLKPIIYVANVSENDLANIESCRHYQTVKEYAAKEHNEVIPVSCEIEFQISELPLEEREIFLSELGLSESGLTSVIRATYRLLNLSTFFTVGPDECRAWTFVTGMSAPECAGIIHTDFQKGFICAEVYQYDSIHELGSEIAVKEAGKLRTEGKGYYPKDGDIMFFKFNVSGKK